MRIIFLSLLICLPILADDDSDRAKLMGTWRGEQDSGNGVAWSFAVQGTSIKVMQADVGNKVADFVCNTDGKPCEIKTAGKKASVSMWFNGSKLVELETKGPEVLERRFSLLPAFDSMELEIVPMVPSGKTETVKLKRSMEASAKR